MKILELEINKVRGIPEMTLKPNGRNLVIWGLNGSGKSAVVDAIDFLLTGRISRLVGSGTGELSLDKHGPHIDYTADDSVISAVIALPGLKQTVKLVRCMAKPKEIDIICESKDRDYVEYVLFKAEKGQHVLARREILKYIHSEPRNRAEQIQDLLNLSDIEDVRRTLVKVKNKAQGEHNTALINLQSAKETLYTSIGQSSFSEANILNYINVNRTVLGGKSIAKIDIALLKKNIRQPTGQSIKGINLEDLDGSVKLLKATLLSEDKELIEQEENSLREAIKEIKSDPHLLKLYSRLALAEQGIKLIDENGECPLCDTPWKPRELSLYLSSKILKGQEYAEKSKVVQGLSAKLLKRFEEVERNINSILSAQNKLDAEEGKATLELWVQRIAEIKDSLHFPIDKYPNPIFDSHSVLRMVAPNEAEVALPMITELFKLKLPEATPELKAWDSLTRLEENIKAFEAAKDKHNKSKIYFKRTSGLHDDFIQARDNILGRLYDDIKDRFVGIYKQLHKSDEGDFTAVIEPAGAGLDFTVDFYGRGNFPPQALHSEGHQDSMGICLYLALAEKINRGLVDLIILDDVVMSVDVNHRKDLCKLLNKEFSDKQFIITTHDRTWANQLKANKLVTSKELVEFHDWSIATGPRVNYDEVIWDKIVAYLEKEEIGKAAWELRHGLEGFFSETCDSIGGWVKYNANHSWQLGDWCPAAIGRYCELLRRAKVCAESWQNEEALKMLGEREKISQGIIEQSQMEQWTINASIHYNNWENLIK